MKTKKTINLTLDKNVNTHVESNLLIDLLSLSFDLLNQKYNIKKVYIPNLLNMCTFQLDTLTFN